MLETTAKFPFVSIFELSNTKDGREIQEAKQPIYKSNGKTPKTSGNFLQHFSRTSSTRKIRTRSSINKGKVPGGIKTKYSSRWKDSPWEKLTKDQEILKIRKGYKIPLLRAPVREKIPLNTLLNENHKFLVEKETKEMLEKGAIKKVSQRSYKDQWSHKYQHAQNQFLSSLFLVRKKDGCYRPAINLKTLNQFVTYMHVKYMMKERDYICIIDLKDAYFTVLLDKSCRHLVRFFMGRESLRMPEPVF